MKSRRTKQIDTTMMRSSGFSFDVIQRTLQGQLSAEEEKEAASQQPENERTIKDISELQLDDFSWNKRKSNHNRILEAVMKEDYPCITITDVQNQTTSVDTTILIYSENPTVTLSDWSPPSSPTAPTSQRKPLRRYPDCGV
ncbi:hypothetical protein DFH28DRAFT_324041 [Melampsora americana]|nr:hypothetical protein DFH28DRAFT_324041 [Melampsora americana]